MIVFGMRVMLCCFIVVLSLIYFIYLYVPVLIYLAKKKKKKKKMGVVFLAKVSLIHSRNHVTFPQSLTINTLTLIVEAAVAKFGCNVITINPSVPSTN